MRDWALEDLEVGMEESFSAVITDEMMRDFARISGDVNPLHLDDEFARAAGHPGRVVYGMLTSSLYSQLVGVWLPGKRCLLRSVEVKFHSPAYVGDELCVSGKVQAIHDNVRMAIIAAQIRNQDGRRISKAKIRVGFTS